MKGRRIKSPATPALSDATCNGADEDCDGQVDEDYVAVDVSCGVGVCVRHSATVCVDGAALESCLSRAFVFRFETNRAWLRW